MSDLRERLIACKESGTIDQGLLDEVIEETGELRKRLNELEIILLMLVRTGWPWQDDGELNEVGHVTKDGYAAAMIQAKKLLGLDHRSMINRTEPKT